MFHFSKFPARTLSKRALLAVLALALAAGPGVAEVQQYDGGPAISKIVCRLLEEENYASKPIDAKVSEQFLKNYLDSYDYNHMILEKSDVDGFEAKYGATLGDLAKIGDVDPAYEIYDRVEKRLEERVAEVKRLTASTFTFTTDETAILDRHDLPWPASDKEAAELWRLRIKHEVLLEKMAKIEAQKAKKPGDKPGKETSIEETIDTRYNRMLNSFKQYSGADILQDYLSSLAHVYDPHSDYLAPPSKADFDISMKLSLEGIGAVLRPEDGYAKIVSLVPGGAADVGKKLKPNDRIEAVAQGEQAFVETVGMSLEDVVALIRGPKGTLVRLRVIPADAVDSATRVVIPIVRDKIKLTQQEAKARVYSLPATPRVAAEKIGVLDVPSFYADMDGGDGSKSLTRDVKRLVAELERRKVDAVVVDLRQDGGGLLAEAVTLTGLFVGEGPVVQVRDAAGEIEVLRSQARNPDYGGPLVVLTSRASASAAEIFAAAMQDYGRGVIVGDKSTYGKGTVQAMISLDRYLPSDASSVKPGALKLTIQKFYRVSGGSTQNKGVTPDIHLPSAGDLSEFTESAEPSALPYDEIAPASYQPANATAGKIPTLASASNARTSVSKEFDWIRSDLDRLAKQRKDKTVSLNLDKRLADRKADEDMAAERKKERLAMKSKEPTFEEITLASLDGKNPAVTVSTGAAQGSDDEPASDEPDAVLDETLHIASDLARFPSHPAGTAATTGASAVPAGDPSLR